MSEKLLQLISKMITLIKPYNKKLSLFKGIFILLLILHFNSLHAATRYCAANGNWNATATWSASSNGGGGASVPVAGDVVFIERNRTVTVNVTNAQCTSITLGRITNATAGTGTLAFATTGNPLLTVSGAVQVGGTSNAGSAGVITFQSGASLIAGSLRLGNPTNNTAGTVNMTNGGTLTMNGAITLGGTGTKTWTPGTGTVVFNATNTLPATVFTTFNNVSLNTGTTTASANISVSGNWTDNNGSFAPATYGVTFTGNSSQINGTAATQTFNNFTVNKTSGQTLSIGGSTTAIVVNGTTLFTAGNFTAPTTFTANGNFTNNSGGFQAGTGTVIMGGNTSTIGGSASTTFYNLTINKSALNRQNLGVNTALNNILTLTSGILALSNYNFTFGADALAVQGSPSASNMIVATGTGRARKLFATNGSSFLLPIGEETGTAEYSPITITIASATFAPGALVEVHVTDAKHPNDGSTTNYLTRYWSVTQAGITNMSASMSATFVAADIPLGSYSNIITSRYIAPSWVEQNVATATTISASSLVAFGDFTGRNNLPMITVSPTSLTGFTYLEGMGPSGIQSLNVSGSALSTNITVLPPADFEISATSGASFSASSILTIDVINREVASTPIYVRMKAGLPAGAVAAQSVSSSSTGVTAVEVSCSGSVTNAPLIEPTVTNLPGSPILTNLSNFAYSVGSPTSASQLFYVKGTYLSGGITLTAPTNYEISLSQASGYAASLVLNQSGGNVASTPIYVRLKTGLLTGNYIENITFTSTNAITKTVTCTGAVNSAIVAVSKFTLAGFIYSGAGPSDVQSFDVSGSNLTTTLLITPPTNFQISTSPTSGFALTAISLSPSSGTIASTPIYVRMRSGLGTGIIAPQNIVVSSTGAISQTVACSGQVTTGATTISSNGTLNGFVYIVNNGPSIQQSFTVSATSLTTSVTVTPPINFEISPSGVEGTFVSSTTNPTVLTISQTGGKVNAVPVYVRMKAGYPVGTYNNQNIVLSSTGATNVNVVCNGFVVNQPSIIAGPTGLDDLCPANNVTLTSVGTNITSQSWTGPNGFTSTAQNPALGTVTATQNGTYTVTGAVNSGVNLLTNGNFELGNVGFGSSYIYQQTAPPEKGNYWISANPQDVYGGFLNSADHSTTGTQMMTVDGGTTNGMVVWSQTIATYPNTNYQFSYWVLNVYNYNNDANKAKLQLFVNNMPIGNLNTAPAYGTSWAQFNNNINSGSNTSLQLTLINKSLEPDGNDFALDDFVFEQIFEVSSSVHLTVNPTLAPSLVVTASDNPVFSGTIVTYTATPTNGGTTPSYQWKVNGVNQGAPTTSPLFDYTPVQGDNISCVLTSTYPCASPQTATANVIMTVNPRTNYWRGNISTNWGTPANWTGGFVPAAGDDVQFAKKSNNNGVAAERNLQLDINRTIGYLINDSAALSVIIPPNLTLIVNNSIQSGTNPDKVIVQASTTLANGSIIYRNSQSTPVYGTVQMYSPASWNTGGGSNNVYNWQYFGIPLSSLDALPTFYGAYVRELLEEKDSISNHWRMLTNESVLVPFKGYELCQQTANTLYTFKGQLVNSNYNSGQLVKTTTGNPLYPGQHLFANPYTSAIDIRQIEFGTNTESTAYLYNTGTFLSWQTNPVKSTFTSLIPGQYTAVPKLQAGSDFFGNQIPRQVPSMGTFMARVLVGQPSTAQSFVSLTYNSVSMGNTDRQRAKAYSTADEQTAMTIDVEGEYGADKMWIMTHEKYTRGFDNGYDGYKMIGTAMNPQLYAVEKDGKYQINSVDDINNTTLAFLAGQDTEYKLVFKHDGKTQQKYDKILLHDLVENRIIDITLNGTEYNFTATSTPDAVIRFKVLGHNTTDASTVEKQAKVYYFDNKIFVQNFSDKSGKVYVYDFAGKTIGIKSIAANENIQISTPRNSVYIVKTVIGESIDTVKLFLK